MKVDFEIENVLANLPEQGKTNFCAMTYEQGIEAALLWVMGEIEDEEMEYVEGVE